MSFEKLVDQAQKSRPNEKYEGYYYGRVTNNSLPEAFPEQSNMLQIATAVPKHVVEAYTDVMKHNGFLIPDAPELSKTLRRWFKRNNMAQQFASAAAEAFVQGAAYWIVGTTDEDTPLITHRGSFGVSVSYDAFGRVAEAVCLNHSPDWKPEHVTRVARTLAWPLSEGDTATHYLPGKNEVHRYVHGQWVKDANLCYATGTNLPLLVPMENRLRYDDIGGQSEIADIANLTDAISRALNNLSALQDRMAAPLRYLFGDENDTMPTPAPVDPNYDPGFELADGDGTETSELEQRYAEDEAARQAQISGEIGTIIRGPKGSDAGQFPTADPTPMISTVKLLMTQIATQKSIPPTMLGVETSNPTSAEALNVANHTLYNRIEAKQEMFAPAMETIARICLEAFTDEPLESYAALSSMWKNPALISPAAAQSAYMQAFQAGALSRRTLVEQLSLDPATQERELAESDRAVSYTDQLGG